MTRHILSFILLVQTGILYAQETMPGYYITKQNDTVLVQIKVPRSKPFNVVAFSRLMEEVEVIDSTQRSKKMGPGECKGFGFFYAGTRYKLMSKPIRNGNYKFLIPISSGPKAGVYHYAANVGGGGGISNSMLYYTFENENGEFIFLTNGATLNRCKEQLKKLYGDNLQIQQLIEKKFQVRIDMERDMKEIVEAVNSY